MPKSYFIIFIIICVCVCVCVRSPLMMNCWHTWKGIEYNQMRCNIQDQVGIVWYVAIVFSSLPILISRTFNIFFFSSFSKTFVHIDDGQRPNCRSKHNGQFTMSLLSRFIRLSMSPKCRSNKKIHYGARSLSYTWRMMMMMMMVWRTSTIMMRLILCVCVCA